MKIDEGLLVRLGFKFLGPGVWSRERDGALFDMGRRQITVGGVVQVCKSRGDLLKIAK